MDKVRTIFVEISIRFAELFVAPYVIHAQLLQEYSFWHVEELNTLVTDDSGSEDSLTPALHHLFEAKLTAMATCADSALDNEVFGCPHHFALGRGVSSGMLDQVVEL